MAAGERIEVLLPDGKAVLLAVDVGDAIGVQVLGRGNDKRDLTDDTLTVDAKLDNGTTSSAKTLTFTADANQTTTGKGQATLVIPAAQVSETGTMHVDLKIQKTGGEANIVKRLQFTIEDSTAD